MVTPRPDSRPIGHFSHSIIDCALALQCVRKGKNVLNLIIPNILCATLVLEGSVWGEEVRVRRKGENQRGGERKGRGKRVSDGKGERECGARGMGERERGGYIGGGVRGCYIALPVPALLVPTTPYSNTLNILVLLLQFSLLRILLQLNLLVLFWRREWLAL